MLKDLSFARRTPRGRSSSEASAVLCLVAGIFNEHLQLSRILLCDNLIVKGNELLKKLRQIAKDRELPFSVDQKQGKGSHSTVYFGEGKTTLPYSHRELKTGTLKSILKDLGLKKEDLS